MSYDESKVADASAHLESTLRDQAPMLELAEAIKTVNAMLAQEAEGYSLEPLYEKIPEALKGYIELVYDLSNNPSLRFMEGLLYKSPYYNQGLQSISLSLCSSSSRPFALSTPKLDDQDRLHLPIPFNHPAVETLFKMKQTAGDPFQVADELSVETRDKERFLSLFTEEPPAKPLRYSGDGVRVRYFGHACVLIETKDTAILHDPVISYKCDGEPPRYTYEDLPEVIDYVLITHGHSDHCIFETLLQLRHKIGTVIVPKSSGGALVDPSLKLILQAIGFDNVRELDEMETVSVKGGTITALPFIGEHADLSIKTKSF